MTRRRLEGQVALITGASRGIGAATARAFAAEGAQLVLVARTIGALEEVDDAVRQAGGSALLVPLDLTHADKVMALGPSLGERMGRLDILVANAGTLGSLGPLAHSNPKQWNQVMALNLTAQYHLLGTLHPLLTRSDAGRAIFLTSSVGHQPRANWGAYAVSKAGLEMMAKIYAAEVGDTPLKVVVANPGATRTTMRAAAYPGEDPGSLKPPEVVAEMLVQLSGPGWTQTGVSVRCAEDGTPVPDEQ